MIGIGGIGVSALAKLFLYWGATVSGSDVQKSEITEELRDKGIEISIGHRERNIPKEARLVIYSGAVPKNNPERKEAKKRRIKELSYFELLGDLSKSYKTIAVAGTHGKSTTTALLGQILIDAGLEPLVIVGSKLYQWREGNIYIGKPHDNQILVLEACEWQRNFLNLQPFAAIITNIDNDHLDTYEDLSDIKKTFYKFASVTSKDGFLVFNDRDKNSSELFKINRPQILVGKDLVLRKISPNNFWVYEKGRRVGNGQTKLLGDFNLQNILTASAAAHRLGVKWPQIFESVKNFQGLWRRLQKIGNINDALLFSDYAHHPTEIKLTLTALKEKYVNKRLVLFFQPHQIHRTKTLFSDFIHAFDRADKVIITEIYGVSGRETGKAFNISELVQIIDKDVIFIKKFTEAVSAFKKELDKKTIGVVMGAGDIHEKFLLRSSPPVL